MTQISETEFELEVGDVLIGEKYGEMNKVTIDRVTKTQVICSKRNMRFPRVIKDRAFFKPIGSSSFGMRYSVLTPESEIQFKKFKFWNSLRNFNKTQAYDLSIEEIDIVSKILFNEDNKIQ